MKMKAATSVLPTHRYAHDGGYVERRLAAHGFLLLHRAEIVVRLEKGVPAPGQLFLARRA